MESQTAHSQAKTTKDDVLKQIIRWKIKPLFLRRHIHRETTIGLIGNKGEGKSGSGSCIALIDYMIDGKPVWSNMHIKCDITVDDDTAREVGLHSGGTVHYESLELKKDALLSLSDEFAHGCIFTDEVNMQYANARRAMSNTNNDFNAIPQQLRHLETSLIYTVIDEMFIDSQLRTMTDMFIKAEDTAYSIEGLNSKKEPGLDFKWLIYPMSAWIVGRERSYQVKGKPLPPVWFHFGRWRGIYDDKELQKRGVYTKSSRDKNKDVTVDMEMQDSPEVEAEYSEYNRVIEILRKLKNTGITEIAGYELISLLGWDTPEHFVDPRKIGHLLVPYGVTFLRKNKYNQVIYQIPDFDLDRFGKTQPLSNLAAATT